MSDLSKNSISIDAAISDVRDLLFNPAGYPEWSSAIKSATVIEKNADGRPSKIEMVIKAGQLKDRVVLDYDWSGGDDLLKFSLDDADMLTEMDGSYELKDNGDETTTVSYQLTVGLSIPIPAMMRNKAERETIDLALKELKEKLES